MLFLNHYRGELPIMEQRRYDALLEGMNKGLSTIAVPFPFSRNGKTVEAVLWDHPEVFYYTDQYSFSGNVRRSEYTFGFPLGKDAAGAYIKQMKAILVSDFNPMLSKGDYEKVLYVHDYLVKRCTYDLTDPDSFRIVGPLLKGHGACQGISLAAMFLLSYLNVPCFFVTGKCRAGIFKSERHGWNAVQVEGKWAFLDVTNDLDGVKSYFLVDERTLLATHSFLVPTLNGRRMDFTHKDLEYHERFGLRFDSVEAAANAASHMLAHNRKAELKLCVPDSEDHAREIVERINLPFAATLSWRSFAPTQTYLFEIS